MKHIGDIYQLENQTPEVILERAKYTGTISNRCAKFPVTFHVSAGANFRLSIEVDPVSIQIALGVRSETFELGSASRSMLLEGKAENGNAFFSDCVDLISWSTGTKGNSIQVSAGVAKVTIAREETISRPLAKIWFRNFKSFKTPVIRNSLGQIEVWGNVESLPTDEVSGSIAVQAGEESDGRSWIERADHFLDYMRHGLAFAHGSRLQSPRKDVYKEKILETTFYQGSGFSSNLAPIHYLNQGPFIEALVKRYDETVPFPDILWTAVGWIQSDARFNEVRFLTSMTALEAIVEHLIPKTLTTVMPKANFEGIRDQLLEIIANSSASKSEQEILEGKIKGLNGRTLSQKVEALLKHYNLSNEIFNSLSIADLIKTRNKITHTGLPPEVDIWSKIVLVRELVTQIVFREVNYVGQYQSFVPSYRMVNP